MRRINGRTESEPIYPGLPLYFSSYSPGDGVTRYRFFTEPTNYFAGKGIYTALGITDALTFVEGYRQGFHREGK